MAESHQEKVVRLIAERSDSGKGPLSFEDRLAILTQMRDDSLCWASVCASENSGRGSAAAMGLYTFADGAIQNVTHAGAIGSEAANILAILGFDPSLVITNGTGERVEA